MSEGSGGYGQGAGQGQGQGMNDGSNMRKKPTIAALASTTTKDSFHTSKKDYNITTKGQVCPLSQVATNTKKVKLIQLD